MVQPKNPPLSVRLPPDVLAALDAERRVGEARNAALVRVLRRAFVPLLLPTKMVTKEELAEEYPNTDEPSRFSVPFAGTFKRGALPKGQKR
jgi:hypothetical protein